MNDSSNAIVLDVLSVGQGHITMTFEPDDMDNARKTIEDMLHRGYAIFVETARGQRRVKRFNPKRMTYIITDAPSEQAVPPTRGGKEREVPAAGSRAKAVGATAGG